MLNLIIFQLELRQGQRGGYHHNHHIADLGDAVLKIARSEKGAISDCAGKYLATDREMPLLGVFLVLVIFPFYWIAVTRSRTKGISPVPITLYPRLFTLQNFAICFVDRFRPVYLNRDVSVVGRSGRDDVALCGAYVLARFNFRRQGRGHTLFFPLLHTDRRRFWARARTKCSRLGHVRFPAFSDDPERDVAHPYSTIKMRGFLQRVPRTLEEPDDRRLRQAARFDPDTCLL
jgi:hypothetical protein